MTTMTTPDRTIFAARTDETLESLRAGGQYKHLRVITERSPAWGDALMSALTFPAEFRDLQACYPIVFAQDEAGDE